MSTSRTLATEVVKSDEKEIVFKLRQEYKPKLMPAGKAVNSLVSLGLDEHGKVVYHKDMVSNPFSASTRHSSFEKARTPFHS